MFTVDELIEMLRSSCSPMGERQEIHGLLVAPDVWAKILGQVPHASVEAPSPIWQWHITVSKHLPAGTIVPVDAKGRPLLKPKAMTPTQRAWTIKELGDERDALKARVSELEKALEEREAETRCRQACQTLIAVFGSIGPEDVEHAAQRAAEAHSLLRKHVTELESALLECRGQLEMLYIARTRIGEDESGWSTVLDALTRANGLLVDYVLADEPSASVGEAPPLLEQMSEAIDADGPLPSVLAQAVPYEPRPSEACPMNVLDAARSLVEYIDKNKVEGELTPTHWRKVAELRGALAHPQRPDEAKPGAAGWVHRLDALCPFCGRRCGDHESRHEIGFHCAFPRSETASRDALLEGVAIDLEEIADNAQDRADHAEADRIRKVEARVRAMVTGSAEPKA